MRRLVLRGIVLVLLNAVGALGALALLDATRNWAPWETDSVLYPMPYGEHFAVAALGSSRAYLLSRMKPHHEALEATVGGPVYNMALPTGGGVRPARYYLESFLARGNRADTLVYFLDPFVLFNEGANDYHKFVYFEPVKYPFLWKLLRDGYDIREVITYVRSKFSRGWWLRRAEPLGRIDKDLAGETIDPERVAGRFESLYPEGMREDLFARYVGELAEILETAEAAGMRIVLVSMPTLLGHEPGHARMVAALDELAETYPLHYVDHTMRLREPALYYNYDHLNTTGVLRYLDTALAPVLAGVGERQE